MPLNFFLNSLFLFVQSAWHYLCSHRNVSNGIFIALFSVLIILGIATLIYLAVDCITRENAKIEEYEDNIYN